MPHYLVRGIIDIDQDSTRFNLITLVGTVNAPSIRD